MGIYFNEIEAIVLFKDQTIVEEDGFKSLVSKLKIAIRVRDKTEGRSGRGSTHPYSPSIKVTDYGKGRSSKHSKTGDPIYFYDDNGKVGIDYDESEFADNKELKYLVNFINHNFVNLKNYWFAPDNIKDLQKLEQFQNKIQDRINYNINNYDYRKEQKPDGEIKL